MNNDMFLTASHIVKRYAEHTALNDVSIQVPRGKVFWPAGSQRSRQNHAHSHH